MEIEQEIIGFSPEGDAVIRYTLTNSIGARVQLLNIGAAVTSFKVPDRKGELREIILGYSSYKEYLSDTLNMGVCVGRYAGRIAKSRFAIGDTVYRLSSNEGTTHINGGVSPFGRKVWSARSENNMVVFSYVSAPNEEGYPSELGVEVGYTLTDDELQVTVVGEADGDTIVNVAPFLYFNLAGEGEKWDMEMKINSSSYVELSPKLIPVGIEPVEGSDMDFKKYRVIEGDYDNYWMMDNWNPNSLNEICSIRCQSSGIELNLLSTQRALYMSNCPDIEGCGTDREGDDLKNYAGVVLSAHNVSDFSNEGLFETSLLREGETYRHYTIYNFKNN